jgi:hypothetical protein
MTPPMRSKFVPLNRCLQLFDLRVDGAIGDFVRRLINNLVIPFSGQAFFQASKVLSTRFVILIEYTDLGLRVVSKNVLGIDPRLEERS